MMFKAEKSANVLVKIKYLMQDICVKHLQHIDSADCETDMYQPLFHLLKFHMCSLLLTCRKFKVLCMVLFMENRGHIPYCAISDRLD